ncbi:MAG: hypothetical protein PHH58_10630 [Rhodoferax sp.]|nr:hypothetical protein [Rhodoferax sp.]
MGANALRQPVVHRPWDNPANKWYFYAPNLQGQGGTALFDYTASKGYLDFTTTGKLLGAGMGFWVNRP